jgi:pyruvate/2-oxoglutarate dehydrogenase complex dihydrolipoamide dehydrogenase (E3) component
MMGFIKLITAKKTNKILGATIMAPHAGLIIQEIALAIRYDMSTYDLANAPHLTNDWSELVRLVCEQV